MSEEMEGDVMDPAAEGVSAQSEEMVPVSAIKGIREELNELKDRNAITEASLREARAALAQGHQPQAKAAPADALEGVEDDDILTAGQVRKLLGQAKGEVGAHLQLSAVTGQPEFTEVFSTYWPLAYKADPSLVDEFNELGSPVARAKFAMRMGKLTPEYKASKIKPATDGPDPSKREGKPRSPAAAGGTSAKSDGAGFYAEASSEEFARHRQKVRARG